MGDMITVEKGCHPWEPAHDARLDVVLNFHDAPLTGTVVQDGVPYLFHCLSGGGRGSSVWAYACLTPGEVETFLGLEGVELLEAVENFIVTRGSVAAVADEERGIEWDRYIESHTDAESYLDTVRGHLKELVDDLSEALSATGGTAP